MNPRRPIRRLDPALVGKIAAGEVVERPASVVKELVENAFDAGSDQVLVRLDGGGLERIEVADDGDGIPAEELPLAVERYATSKLSEESQMASIGTLGFRGEALAAIAAVSRLTIVSRTPEAEAATGLEVDGGTVGRPFVAARSPGTTVTVRELFRELPARRKFLKSPAAEQLEVLATLDRLHLAQPGVGLAVEANGAPIARYAPTESLREAATEVLGAEFDDRCLPVTGQGPGGRLVGWIGRPPLSRSTSGGLHFAVNGRAVQLRSLAQAARAGVGDYLPRTRFPVGVLQLAVPLDRVDVNVHPTKREVRFARDSGVDELVRTSVRAAMLGAPQEALGGSGGASVSVGPMAVPEGPREDSDSVSPVFAPALRQTRFEEPTLRPVSGSVRHPPLVLLGPVAALYWAAESGEDLVLVDQHAASERVLFDELLQKGRLARQELVEPVRLSLSARQVAALASEPETIEASGFVVEPFGADTYRVHAVPSYRGRRAAPEELPRLLDELADGGRPSVPDGLRERTAASIACHAAVRGGDAISPEEMGRVLEALYRIPESAATCPHGRPILVRFPRGRLDRWFGRSGA